MVYVFIINEPTHATSKENNGTAHPMASYTNYLLSKISIALCCQQCSTHCTAVWITYCLKSTSVIKVATVKNIWTISVSKKSHLVLQSSPTLLAVCKDEWTQRRTLVSSWRIHCTYWQKNTFKAEVKLNREKYQVHTFSHCWVTLV